LMMPKILLACTLLAIDGRRVKKDSESLQSEQERRVSGPKTKALLPLLMAFNMRPSDAFEMMPGVPRGGGSHPAIPHGAVEDNWYPLHEQAKKTVPLTKKAMVPAARAGLGPTMAAQEDFFKADEGFPEGFPWQPARKADEPNDMMGGVAAPPPLPSAGDQELLQAANTFLYTASGFYGPPRQDAFADNFVFCSRERDAFDLYENKVSKDDYLDELGMMDYKKFPDITPNAFGFAVDPHFPRLVWFSIRNVGMDTLPRAISFFGFGMNELPMYIGTPEWEEAKSAVTVEIASVKFDKAGKVRLLTVGF